MKKLVLILAVIFMPVIAFAGGNEETLISSNIESGGFGAPVVQFSSINGDFAVFTGARGGWIINHSFCIGAGFYSLTNRNLEADYTDPSYNNIKPTLEIELYGLEFEYCFNPSSLIHFTVLLNIGAGRVSYSYSGSTYSGPNSGSDLYGNDWYFSAMPQANLELNLTSWFRAEFGGGYRYANGVKYSLGNSSWDNTKLSSPYGAITLKFGKF